MKYYLTLIGVITLAILVGVAGGYLSRKTQARSLQASSQFQPASRPMTREQMARLIAQTAARSAARAANSVLVQQAAMVKRQRLVASVETRGIPAGEPMQAASALKAH